MSQYEYMMEMFLTAIVLVFASCISYNHADELPKFPFSDTPGSSDTSESPWDPQNSGYMPFVTPDFIQEFSSSQAQQPPSKVEDPVFKPVGLGLNGWGRIPRVPKLSHRGSNHLRPSTVPSPPTQAPPTVQPPAIQPLSVWTSLLAVKPPFEPPSPTPIAERSPFKAPTSITKPPTLNPTKPPSPAFALLDEWAASPTVSSPTMM